MRWALLAVLALLATGCEVETPEGVACPAFAAAGLDVSVLDDVTGQPVCDAVVTATEGAYAETLSAFSCRHVGAFERPGTYLLRATRSRYRDATLTGVRVVIGTGDCPHVQQVHVDLRLTPAP